MKVAAVAALLLLPPPSPTLGQSLPDVPPLPIQEQLRERDDLTATLVVSKAEITAGEVPQFTLVLTNRGKTRLRTTTPYVSFGSTLRVFDSSGEEMLPRSHTSYRSVLVPTRVRTLPSIPAGGSRAFPLRAAPNMPDALPSGDYVFRVTYQNWAGAQALYDVRERGAEEVWEGVLTASAAIRVRPVDPSSEQRLLEEVRNGDRASAVEAMRVLGLSRSTAAVDAIVERLERDYTTLPEVMMALGYIATPHAARALAAAHMRVPIRMRYEGPFVMATVAIGDQDVRRLIRGAGCDALALGPLAQPSRQVAESLRSACRGVTETVRAEVLSRKQAQTSTDRQPYQQEVWARDMLKWLESPPPQQPPLPPAAQSHDEFPAPPVAERLPEYVAAIVDYSREYSERVQVALSGVARFGTHETFRQLRAALNTAGNAASLVIGQALVALTFDDNVVAVSRGPSDPGFAEDLRRWDGWWRQHERQSREQWARDAIVKRPALSEGTDEIIGASRAAEYLLVLNRPRYEQTLVTHPSWRVRIRAAVTLAADDPRYAAALLLRELENRYTTACFNTGYQLASLTGSWFPFECSEPEERKAAAAHYTRLVLERR